MANNNKKNKMPELFSAEQLVWQTYTQNIKPLECRKKIEYIPPTLNSQNARDKSTLYLPPLPLMPFKLPDLNINRTVQSKNLKRPKQIDGRLDLHGLKQTEAYPEVMNFITRHAARGSRILLIITGKGFLRNAEYQMGVLAEALPQWLTQPPLKVYIRTFSYAHYKDGGTGAFYIFLKTDFK